jgi:hypothetical protein
MRIGLCLLLVMLVSCTTLQEVTPYSGPTATATICVVSHAAVKPGVLEAITEELAERGIAHRVIVGRYVKHHNSWQSSLTDGERDGCDAILRYVANWSWDIATYMYFASLWMTDSTDTNSIGRATYDASRNAGLGKFINARSKIRELVGEMVEGRRE